MSLSSKTARDHLANLITTAAATGTNISDDDLDRAVNRIVAAEFRALSQDLISEDNPNVIWRALVQRANELDSPAVDR
jgi:hypothetical protein